MDTKFAAWYLNFFNAIPRFNSFFFLQKKKIYHLKSNILSWWKLFSPLENRKLARSMLCKYSKRKPIAIDLKPIRPPEKKGAQQF